jgi:hypothetical protein
MKGQKVMKRRSVKNFKSPQEIDEFPSEHAEAEFWQTHSPVDIFDQLPKADDVEFVPRSKRLIPLPMDERIYKEVQRQARRLGMSPLTLIQKLVEISLRGGKSPTRRVR